MTHVATIPKNSREELRVTLDEFRGHHLLNLRIWFTADDGEMRPSKKGCAIKLDRLSDLQAALARADALARQSGLFDGRAA